MTFSADDVSSFETYPLPVALPMVVVRIDSAELHGIYLRSALCYWEVTKTPLSLRYVAIMYETGGSY